MQEQNYVYPQRHRHSYLASPVVTVHHNSTGHTRVRSSPLLNSSFSVQCSAYFLHRYDLSDYAVNTLKRVVDVVVSTTQSKGLKVKLSLPDDGLIVENLSDANQSWMFKQNELLYFWPDPFYLKIIVVISRNHQTPYSASIFRLRGEQSVQQFLQRAQQFFANLSRTSFIEKSSTIDRQRARSKKTKSSHSLRTRAARLVTRTEFNPGQTSVNDSIGSLYHRRSYSETSDSYSAISQTLLSTDYVAQLVRELKELRQEIATLKLESRTTPVRSMSTSPIHFHEENSSPIDLNWSKNDVRTVSSPQLSSRDESALSNQTDSVTLPSTSVVDETNCSSTNEKENSDVTSHQREFSTQETVSFHSTLENSNEPPEHIYENVPIVIHMKSSQANDYNVPISQANSSSPMKNFVYVNIDDNPKSENDQLNKQQDRVSLILPIDSDNWTNNQLRPPTQIHFANHLTNPLFHVDRQLLTNTIANQFGIDLHSPYLQQLISNQHLFVAHKRTYANMVWQMTPDEIKALCSTPTNMTTEIESTMNSTKKSILKTASPLRSVSKRSRISWSTITD